MQIWCEVIQLNCHHKCQSLWPRGTQTELPPRPRSWSSGFREVGSGQTQAATPHSHSYTCSYCHALLLQPQGPETHVPFLQILPLSSSSLFPSLAPWQPAHLSSVDTGITAILFAHFLTVHLLKLLILLWASVGLLNSLAPELFVPSIQAATQLIRPPS